MSQREDCLKFETGRIKALQEERLHIQKKTFTKWMNSFLGKARMEVEDLFTDLADGKKLLKLLEIISGEKLGKPNSGKMRVHKIENVNKSLAFLHTKVRLESIGAEDIVDGNPRLILGLIWTIILRFQIQEIEIDVDEDNESSEKKSAKDALLLWCQRKTNGYSNVNIQDFTGSWRSGMGFNALIHAHRPDLIDYDALVPSRHIDNLNNAFDVAERDLGILRLLDAEDIDTAKPDEKSVLTYVASYYHTFARMKNEIKGGRRIANIVGQIMDADKLKTKYEKFSTTLLEWIRITIIKLSARDFPNSLDEIQKELMKFKEYRTVEKPPKYNEKSEIEVCYFNINTRLKELKQPLYNPPDGQLIHDVERAWELLEKAEHQRELALREELIRQTHLEQLALRFEKKSILREGYLKDMIQVLSDPRYGSNLVQVEATLKKHEAISADILAREERCAQLTTMADYLVEENYHGKDRIKKRADEIMSTWNQLLALLDSHKINLGNFNNLMSMLREIDTISATIKDLDETFQSGDVGLHLLAVEDLLQKHSLLESQIAVMGETIKRLNRAGAQYVTAEFREHALLQNRLANLGGEHVKLLEQSKERRSKLEDSRSFFQFVQDHEEEEAWLVEKQRICKTGISAKDLRAVVNLQQKHKAVLDEMKARQTKSNKVIEAGQELMSSHHPESKDIQERILSLQSHWNTLRELAAVKEKKLKDAAETYHFYADANEADSWIIEKRPLVASTDYGEDETSGQALLQRHKDLQGEIIAYEVDIKALNGQAAKLIKAGISTLEMQEPEPEATVEEEWAQEQKLVPQEFWEEEPIERTEYKTVTEERAVPQIKALYQFSGSDVEMAKGEVMFLLNKTNNDWWNVRKANGADGFVPANYVKEIEPKVVQVQVRKPEVIQEIRKVKKTKMVLQNVMVKKSKSPRPAPRGSKRPAEDHEPVEKRQNKVNGGYQEIVQLAKKRHAYLEDAIRLFGFYRECDDFEKWIREKEKLLNTDDKNETVESAKRKFEKFLTDLSASSRRVEVIDKMVDEFVATEHSQIDKVRMRQRQVHMLWDHLNQMKAMKERSLEGASSVELFNRTCDETRDWMLEKMTQIDTDDMGRDLKTVEALQRRHKNLERELAPIEEKISRVNDLANSVVASYPNEKKNVLDRQKEIQNLWDELTQKAIQRRARLEEAVGQQIFMNSSKNLLGWVSDTKDALNAYEPARDVSTAEALLKKHQDLGDDMRAHEDEFEEVVKLGASLVRNNPEAKEVPERLMTLKEERNALHRGWQEKGDWLQQAMDLQMFNREADHIDTATSGHHAFLSYDDLGSTLDEVEGLMKRHQDFENTLVAQDERLKLFSEMANKLIDARHYDFKNIDDRRNGVLTKRKGVKDRAKERKENLAKSNKYHCFQTEVDDMKSWIAEKTETAKDESYKDLTNLERKLQKHEAFTRELTANEVQLKNINKAGAKLMNENERRKEDIAKELKELNEAWDQLRALSEDKRTKLNQADAQHTYNKTLENVRLKLDEMENQLNSKEMGTDRRACKENLKKHQLLESEMNSWDNKLADLYKHGDEMQADGHFDGKNIKKNVQDCLDRLKNLKGPADERRRALEELLRFYDFVFEIDAELQWIKEHATAATSETLPQDLHQAQTLFKKHKKLEAEIVGHHPMIEKTLANGANLISQKHPEKENITEKCGLLGDSWKELEDAAKDRAKRLDLALKAQQFFSDASEVETWMNEKNNILSSKDFGKDKDASVKLLTKHKGLELEMDSYSGLVNEMSSMAQAMVNAKHPDSKVINNKQETIVQQMKNLQKLANERRMKLMESMQRHEYFWESEDFEKWMDDQLQTAMSEDYGHDYEHLLMLQSKFDDFKLRIEGSSERFKMLDDLAKKLIASGSPYSKDIDSQEEHLHDDIPQLVSQKHEVICEKWNNLLAHIQARDQKLQAAGEIHRFNRDVADALARIQEKVSSIPEGVGRDVNSCESMLRIHESFEIDLLALEAQLQVLVDDAARLQSLYPTNAQNIREEQNLVIESWNDLQTRAAQKKEELQAAADFHRFSSAVRDLMNWSASLQSTMLTQEKVRDTTSAQILMTEHDRLKGEIEAREEKFQNVISLGQSMIEDEHSASKEVSEKIEILSREKERLQLAWEKKKIYLDQLIDLQIFLRDAKQLDTLCNSQEVTLSSTDLAETVEEVDAQLKKHDAFEKLLQTQEDKFNLLQDQGGKLIRQNHFESPTVKTRMTEVAEHRVRVKSLGKKRRARLEDNLLYVQFLRDVAEAGSWIDEKKKKLEVEATQSSVTTLEEKIKKLKKHQAFEAELSANEPRILQIMNKGQQLVDKNHEKSKEIQEQMKHFLEEWKNLLKQSKNCGKGLEEAQDILDFNNQVEKVEAWIREKELLVVASDVGRDYEHCQEIQRKLDDVNSDMRVDDFGIKSINQLAEKLEKQNPNPSGHKPVEERKTRLNSKWKDLKGALVSYREKLAGALEIHAFNRDVDDTLARINEKMLTMSVDDVGKDLDSVESLLRRQDALERDMSAIGQKLSDLTNEQSRLIHKFPEEEKPITDKLGGVKFSWDELSTACINRRTALSDSYTLHKFMKDLRELDIWVEDMVGKMGAGDLPNSSIEAEALLQLHQERKAEILGRQDNFNTLKKFGHRLVTEGHSSKTDLKNGIEQLETLRSKLNSSCEQREDKLKQAQQLQQFNKMAEEADSLLADKEAFLNNDDLGDSLSSVELLIRKHDAFEKTLDVQLKRVDELQKFGEELVEGNHYSKASITTKLRELKKRQEKLRGTADARRSKLEDSQDLNQFLRNVHEVEGWILEKMQIATDECYRDMSNLQSKIQKHQAFESELQANESRVSAAYQEGEGLLEDGEHFASNEISNRLDELKNLWKQLQDSTTLRKDRLHEAYQALLFNQNLDDLDIWMDEMEGQLGSEDHGKDLTSVQHLLKKWHQLNNEFTHHGEQIEQIKQSASAFEKSNHFLKDDIKERVDGILKRYSALQEPLHIRKDNLEDALKLYQFMRDIEDELQWMAEKEPLGFSEDLGTSLPSVQSLQKKHTALEAEIQTHEPFVVSLVTRGQQMVRSKHFASEEISGKIETVQGKLSSLKDGATLRKLRLVDAVQSQSFYTEASEAETWMKEKKPYLSSVDYGKDEDSVQSLMKKLEVNQRDLLNFGQTMNKLIATSQDLIERNHFDTENIKVVTGQVKENYSELQKLSDKRKQRLIDAEKLFRFVRDADEVGEWIQEQMNIAGSEDYGRDVEHVEILIQKFEAFMTTLNNTGENRIAAVQHSADHLIEEGHPEPEKITGKAKEIKHVWEECKELVSARQEALHGAKQVHMFDRTADETIGWINEKDAAISSEDYGHDLESIQALVRKQQVFERDLAAVKEQVESVLQEARRLDDLFPDAREHIGVKHEETVEAWNELLDKSATRKDKLNQAEQLQAYFDTYRELLVWINETVAKVTAPELSKDVAGSEALISRHKEYKAEIGSKSGAIEQFTERGRKLIRDGHFLADEINEKVRVLMGRWEYLTEIWEVRRIIYDQSLDLRIFLRDAIQLESWLVSREPVLKDGTLGDSIAEAEEILKRHEDFEKTIDAQSVNLDLLRRKTMIEVAFSDARKKEMEAKKEEAKRAEKERVEAIKRKEVLRITDERKREDERRRTQEIKFNRDELDRVNGESDDQLKDRSHAGDNEASHWKPSLGVGNLFGDRLRRGSDPGLILQPLKVRIEISDNVSDEEDVEIEFVEVVEEIDVDESEVKRSESFKVDSKKPKRTPSFTTRRRTQSFRKLKKMDNVQDLPPVEISGYLERKHELQSGGKRAAVRSWKNYYVVLCGQLLCFFKDRDDFAASKAATSPIMVYQAVTEKATDYTKRKHVFRLKPTDGSEYLFLAEDEQTMEEWVKKLSFHAQLPPSQQLTSYDTHMRLGFDGGGSGGSSQDLHLQPIQEPPATPVHKTSSAASTNLLSPIGSRGSGHSGDHENDGDASSSSSNPNTPDTPRRPLNNQPRSREPVYANVDVLQDSEPRLVQKPPIPPRTSSIDNMTSSPAHANNGRGDERHSSHSPQSPNANGNGKGFTTTNGNNGNVDDVDGGWNNKRHSYDTRVMGVPPPLPVTSPPAHLLPPGMRHALYNNSNNHANRNLHLNNDRIIDPYRQVYSAGGGSPGMTGAGRHDLRQTRTGSLPPGTIPPTSQSSHPTSNIPPGNLAERRQLSSTLENQRRSRHSESSSESDSPNSHQRGGKDERKKSSGLMGLFRRKKATQL